MTQGLPRAAEIGGGWQMELLVAIGHIAVAFIVQMILGFAILFVTSWEKKKNGARALQEAAVTLGVPVADLDSPELWLRVVKYSADRYSNELLRNRLSDFCGVIRTVWDWLGALIQGGILLGVLWYTFTDSRDSAIYAWTILPVMIFFWVAPVAFSFVCRVLTGRYPSEARLARKVLAENMTTTQAVA